MTPSAFAGLALALEADAASDEAKARTSVSRHYYAAFLEARDRLIQTTAIRVRSKNAHDVVQKSFGRSLDGSTKVLGRLLEDLKKLRVQADYDLATALGAGDAGDAKALYRDIEVRLKAQDFTKCVDGNVA